MTTSMQDTSTAHTVSIQIDEWKARIGRDLNKFEQLVVARPFRWNEFDNSWYRLIKPVWDGEPQGYLEVRITPGTKSSWAKVSEIQIKLDRTSIDKREILKSAAQLHPQLKFDMVQDLGEDLTATLLYGNLFPLIDMDKFKSYLYNPNFDNKEVPLSMITNVTSDEKVT